MQGLRLVRSARRVSSSFASQLLLVFAVALVAPVVFTGTLIRSDLDGAERAAWRLAEDNARQAANEIERVYIRDVELTGVVADLDEFWNGSDEERDSILDAFGRPHPVLNSALFFTDDFQEHGRANRQPGDERRNLAIRSYAQEAVATGKPAFADEVVLSRSTGAQLVSMVLPVRESVAGGRHGYLGVGLRAGDLASLWNAQSLPQDSSVLLVDGRSERVLGGTSNSPFVINSVVEDPILTMLHSESTSFRLALADGPWLFTKRSVDRTPWVVFVRMPMSGLLNPIYSTALQRGLLLLALAGLIAILVLRVWLQMHRRLRGLQESAAEWSGGNWDYRTTLDSADEFRALKVAFNTMAQQLQDLFNRERQIQVEIERERAVRAAVMAGMTDGLLVSDRNGRIIEINQRAGELLGLDAESLRGQSGDDVLSAVMPKLLDAEKMLEVIEQAGHSGERGERSSDEMTMAGPPQRDLQVQIFPFASDDAGGVGVLLHDITAERDLVRAKDELVSMVSHELASPATNLTTYAQLLVRSNYDPAEQHDMLETMVREGKRMTAMVRDFLDIQRLKNGRLSVTPKPTDLRAILEQSGKIAQRDTDHTFILELPERLPIVQADPDRLQQVLSNLLSNASKYTPTGGEIRLSARTLDRAVEVSVADNGLGILPEALPRLFEKFYRVDGEDRRLIRGTGLGLAIVKEIVEAQDGQLGVESAGRNQGSRFWFTLPIAAEDAPVAATSTPLARSTSAQPVGSIRVLAVDDDPAMGNVVRRVLRSAGHTVATVTSAEDALARLHTENFEVVISDLGLGKGMDGWQLAREVHAEWPRVRFVLATGSGGIDQAEARARGVDELLEKPYRPDDLLGVVARLVNQTTARAA